eukprot:4146926-Prymnesium_polylepis.1
MRAIGTPRLDVAHEFDHLFWMGDLNYRVDLNNDAMTLFDKWRRCRVSLMSPSHGRLPFVHP